MIPYFLFILNFIKKYIFCLNVETHTHHHTKYDPKTGNKVESDDFVDELTSTEKHKKCRRFFNDD